MLPHLHFAELQLSAINLSPAEEAGFTAMSYGMPSGMLQHRLPASYPSPLLNFFASPARSRPSPSSSRPAPAPHRSGSDPGAVVPG